MFGVCTQQEPIWIITEVMVKGTEILATPPPLSVRNCTLDLHYIGYIEKLSGPSPFCFMSSLLHTASLFFSFFLSHILSKYRSCLRRSCNFDMIWTLCPDQAIWRTISSCAVKTWSPETNSQLLWGYRCAWTLPMAWSLYLSLVRSLFTCNA